MGQAEDAIKEGMRMNPTNSNYADKERQQASDRADRRARRSQQQAEDAEERGRQAVEDPGRGEDGRRAVLPDASLLKEGTSSERVRRHLKSIM